MLRLWLLAWVVVEEIDSPRVVAIDRPTLDPKPARPEQLEYG